MLDKVKQYLSGLSIESDQKRYAMNFCKKAFYLNELHEIAIQDTKEYVCTGYGNVNSKICFVFKDKNKHDTIKPLLQDMLDKFNINPWDVYVTFVNKTQVEYNKKYSFLINEIHAINPGLLYVFDNDDTMYKEIIESFNSRNVSLPEKHFMIDVNELACSDIEVRKELWNIFRYLINYKEIE